MQRLPIWFMILLMLSGCQSSSNQEENTVFDWPAAFDWQGHRGARGLVPENTIPAFLKALTFPVKTLELDLAVTRDSFVVLSHEPWLSASICSHPDGSPVSGKEEKELSIFSMTYASLSAYDCGSRGNPGFPEQEPLAASKPLLSEMIDAVEAYCRDRNRPLPYYNMEIKSKPEWDEVFTPDLPTFAGLVLEILGEKGVRDRTCIQSFDPRALQAVRQLDSTVTTALLVANLKGVEANLGSLGFVPDIYSPEHRLVTGKVVEQVRSRQMQLIPWTVNQPGRMQELIELGVDGIITDYPNRIPVQ